MEMHKINFKVCYYKIRQKQVCLIYCNFEETFYGVCVIF